MREDFDTGLAGLVAANWAASCHVPPFTPQATGQPWESVLSRACWEDVTRMKLPTDYANEATAIFLIRWFQAGLPRFDLGHHAATAFALTDVSDVRWEDVRFPFGTTLITMPSPSPIQMLGISGRWLDVRRITVQQFFRYSREDTDSIRSIIEGLRRGVGDANALLAFKSRSFSGYDFCGYAEDGTQLFAYASLRPGEETVHASLFGRLDIAEDDRRAMHAVVSVAVNVALWLAQSPALVAKPAVRRTDRRGRVTNDSGYRPAIYAVGETIKLGEFTKLREHARAYFEQGGERGGWRVQARHSVRGHWKQQVFGVGRGERKRVFVSPYWRGPEAGEALSKTYEIKGAP